MNKNHKNQAEIIKRIIAGLTAVLFAFSAVMVPAPGAYVVPAAEAALAPAGELLIPETLGTIQDAYLLEALQDPDAPFVIHLQDAHANVDAQISLMKILDHLSQRHGLDLVALEGTSSGLDLRPYRAIRNKDLVRDLVKDFLAQRIFTGPEAFAILREEAGVESLGVETAGLYIQNVIHYRNALEKQDEALRLLGSMETALERLLEHASQKRFRELVRQKAEFESGRTDLLYYLSFLKALTDKLYLDVILEDYPAVKTFFGYLERRESEPALELEAQAEERQLVQTLLPDEAEAYWQLKRSITEGPAGGSVTPLISFIEERLSESGKDWKSYPKLKRHLEDFASLARYNGPALFDELYRFETELAQAAMILVSEKHLWEISGRLSLVKKLFRLELTPQDYDALLGEEADGKTGPDFHLMIGRMREIAGQDQVRDARIPEFDVSLALSDLFQQFIIFYAVAKKRDRALVQNTVQAMGRLNAKRTALVTGGFHAEGIRSLLREGGIPYVSVAPKITEIRPEDANAYQVMIQGRIPALAETFQRQTLALTPFTAEQDVLGSASAAGSETVIPEARRTDGIALDVGEDIVVAGRFYTPRQMEYARLAVEALRKKASQRLNGRAELRQLNEDLRGSGSPLFEKASTEVSAELEETAPAQKSDRAPSLGESIKDFFRKMFVVGSFQNKAAKVFGAAMSGAAGVCGTGGCGTPIGQPGVVTPSAPVDSYSLDPNDPAFLNLVTSALEGDEPLARNILSSVDRISLVFSEGRASALPFGGEKFLLPASAKAGDRIRVSFSGDRNESNDLKPDGALDYDLSKHGQLTGAAFDYPATTNFFRTPQTLDLRFVEGSVQPPYANIEFFSDAYGKVLIAISSATLAEGFPGPQTAETPARGTVYPVLSEDQEVVVRRFPLVVEAEEGQAPNPFQFDGLRLIPDAGGARFNFDRETGTALFAAETAAEGAGSALGFAKLDALFREQIFSLEDYEDASILVEALSPNVRGIRFFVRGPNNVSEEIFILVPEGDGPKFVRVRLILEKLRERGFDVTQVKSFAIGVEVKAIELEDGTLVELVENAQLGYRISVPLPGVDFPDLVLPSVVTAKPQTDGLTAASFGRFTAFVAPGPARFDFDSETGRLALEAELAPKNSTASVGLSEVNPVTGVQPVSLDQDPRLKGKWIFFDEVSENVNFVKIFASDAAGVPGEVFVDVRSVRHGGAISISEIAQALRSLELDTGRGVLTLSVVVEVGRKIKLSNGTEVETVEDGIAQGFKVVVRFRGASIPAPPVLPAVVEAHPGVSNLPAPDFSDLTLFQSAGPLTITLDETSGRLTVQTSSLPDGASGFLSLVELDPGTKEEQSFSFAERFGGRFLNVSDYSPNLRAVKITARDGVGRNADVFLLLTEGSSRAFVSWDAIGAELAEKGLQMEDLRSIALTFEDVEILLADGRTIRSIGEASAQGVLFVTNVRGVNILEPAQPEPPPVPAVPVDETVVPVDLDGFEMIPSHPEFFNVNAAPMQGTGNFTYRVPSLAEGSGVSIGFFRPGIQGTASPFDGNQLLRGRHYVIEALSSFDGGTRNVREIEFFFRDSAGRNGLVKVTVPQGLEPFANPFSPILDRLAARGLSVPSLLDFSFTITASGMEDPQGGVSMTAQLQGASAGEAPELLQPDFFDPGGADAKGGEVSFNKGPGTEAVLIPEQDGRTAVISSWSASPDTSFATIAADYEVTGALENPSFFVSGEVVLDGAPDVTILHFPVRVRIVDNNTGSFRDSITQPDAGGYTMQAPSANYMIVFQVDQRTFERSLRERGFDPALFTPGLQRPGGQTPILKLDVRAANMLPVVIEPNASTESRADDSSLREFDGGRTRLAWHDLRRMRIEEEVDRVLEREDEARRRLGIANLEDLNRLLQMSRQDGPKVLAALEGVRVERPVAEKVLLTPQGRFKKVFDPELTSIVLADARSALEFDLKEPFVLIVTKSETGISENRSELRIAVPRLYALRSEAQGDGVLTAVIGAKSPSELLGQALEVINQMPEEFRKIAGMPSSSAEQPDFGRIITESSLLSGAAVEHLLLDAVTAMAQGGKRFITVFHSDESKRAELRLLEQAARRIRVPLRIIEGPVTADALNRLLYDDEYVQAVRVFAQAMGGERTGGDAALIGQRLTSILLSPGTIPGVAGSINKTQATILEGLDGPGEDSIYNMEMAKKAALSGGVDALLRQLPELSQDFTRMTSHYQLTGVGAFLYEQLSRWLLSHRISEKIIGAAA